MRFNIKSGTVPGYGDLNFANRSGNINASTASVLSWEVCGYAVR
jgi:hypothetical protein